MAKLIFLCGSSKEAYTYSRDNCKCFRPLIPFQRDTDLEIDMFHYGYTVYPKCLQDSKEDWVVFSNNTLVLHGIRLAVKHGKVSPEDVLIRFFTEGTTPPQCPTMDRHGGLSTWPQGFFDTMDFVLSHLLDYQNNTPLEDRTEETSSSWFSPLPVKE